MLTRAFSLVSQYGLQAMLVLPMLMTMINEATEAVEAIGGPGTGEAKKEAVLEAVEAAYDLAEMAHPGTLPIDKLSFSELAAGLIETVLRLQSARRAFGG